MFGLAYTAFVGYKTLKDANDTLELLEYTNLISADTESRSLLISEKIICKLLNKAIKKRDMNSNPKSYFYVGTCTFTNEEFVSGFIVLEYEKFGKVAFRPKFIKIEKENVILHYDAFLAEKDGFSLTYSVAKKVTSDLRWIDFLGIDSLVDTMGGVNFKEQDDKLDFIGINKTYLLNNEISGIYSELLKILNQSSENAILELEVYGHKLYVKNPNLSDHILWDVLILLRKIIRDMIEKQ